MRQLNAALSIVFVFLVLIVPISGNAEAATADCLTAARFSILAEISDGSMSQFAETLGLSGKTPPENGCRAVLLTGPITKGSAAALLGAIERNKGWLAQVYIATSDGDLKEELELEHLMRAFALGGVLLESDGVYVPDFVTIAKSLPSSVSNSWSEADRMPKTPIALSYRDYLDNTDRKIPAAPVACGASCWTIFAGAIERQVEHGNVPRSQGTSPTQSREDASLRDLARHDLGAKFGLVKAGPNYSPTEKFNHFAKLDWPGLESDCRSAADYANTFEVEIARFSNEQAVKGYPFMRLAPQLRKFQLFQDASNKADLCMRKALSRLRLSLFETQCAMTCEAKLHALETVADGLLHHYAEAVKAGANTPSALPFVPSGSSASGALHRSP